MSDEVFQVTDNFPQVLDYLRRLQRRVSDLTPAMRQVAGVLLDIPEQAFRDEADPTTGDAWHPYAGQDDPNSYLNRPRDKGGRGGEQHPMLQYSGHLAASFQSGYDASSAWAGTNVVYAAPLNEDRPIVGFNDEHAGDVLDILETHLLKAT